MASDVRSLTLAPVTASIAVAGDEVEQTARSASWSAHDVDRVVLGTIEAVGNAVEHGPGRPIRLGIAWSPDAQELVIEVADGGEGPHEERLSGATLPEVEAAGGRGLFIVRALADDVHLAGGVLRLVFRQGGVS